jgi:hypothetical protein
VPLPPPPAGDEADGLLGADSAAPTASVATGSAPGASAQVHIPARVLFRASLTADIRTSWRRDRALVCAELQAGCGPVEAAVLPH